MQTKRGTPNQSGISKRKEVHELSASEPLDRKPLWPESLRLPGLLFLNAIALFPMLLTGYCGDDVLNSQIRGEMIQTHRSLWQVVSYYALAWMRNEGRFFPLAFSNFVVFYVIRSVFLYKVIILCTVLAGLAVFYLFLRDLTGTHSLPVAYLLVLPLFLQFRAVWDPVLGFSGQYPLLALSLFASLFLFLKYLDGSSTITQVVAVLLFLCCGMLFETSYLLCLLFGAVAFSRLRNLRAALQRAWPYFAVTAFLVLVSVVLKKRAVAPNPAYVPNLVPLAIAKGYLIQTFGAVPFSYYLFDPAHIFTDRSLFGLPLVAIAVPMLLLLAVLAVLLSWQTWSVDQDQPRRTHPSDVFVFGLLLFALPQALISLSARYQAMPWGNAYIPVYLTRMGLALLVAAALLPLVRRCLGGAASGKWVASAMAITWLALFGLNLHNNLLVTVAENKTFWHPRTLLESSLRRGLLAKVPSGSVLLVGGSYLWDIANEYSALTGREFLVRQLGQPSDAISALQQVGAACQSGPAVQGCRLTAESPVYTVQIRHLGNGDGAVVLSRVTRVLQEDNRVRGVLAVPERVFFRFPGSTPSLVANMAGTQYPRPGALGVPFFADQNALDVIGAGRDWELFSFKAAPALDALSLQAFFSPDLPRSVTVSEKNPASYELLPAGPTALHTGYAGGNLGSGVVKPPLPASDQLSIEVLVTPGDQQVTWADILSNHGPGFGGFAIEQQANQTNLYSVVVGDGKAWIEIGQMQLTPNSRHYISVQVNGRDASIYLDGRVISRKLLPSPPASSSYGVSIGNWVGGGRQFNGLIEEVCISRGTRSAAAISADASRLRSTSTSQMADDNHLPSGKTP
jgi:hypothetical protein